MIKTILAGDLSLACPAFCVMKVNLITQKVSVHHLSHVKTTAKNSTSYRLWKIAHHLETEILDKYPIDDVVVEKGFSRFPTATQQLQRVVGTVFYTLYRKHGIDADPDEIAVTTVKKAVTGNGKADKAEVAFHLSKYVGEIKYKTDDESDAVAVAIAYAKKKKWIE